MKSTKVERWVTIPVANGYEVSDQGRIRSVDRIVVRSDGVRLRRSGQIIRQMAMKKGYLRVRLRCNDGKIRHFLSHRLVLMSFVGASKLETNHKKGIKSDNRLSQLEYATPTQNAIHAESSGLRYHARGSKHGRSKLHERDVKDIKRRLFFEEDYESIASLFGVHRCTIRDIDSGRNWRHI
jgi:chorismate mutase